MSNRQTARTVLDTEPPTRLGAGPESDSKRGNARRRQHNIPR